jgi:putative transposase
VTVEQKIRIVGGYADQTTMILTSHWVVERTFAWLDTNRRLSKAYEALIDTRTDMLYIAMTRLLLRRLASD